MEMRLVLSPAQWNGIQHYLMMRAAHRALQEAADFHRTANVIPAEQHLVSIGLDAERVGQDVNGFYAMVDVAAANDEAG
jgi:hypothetical protein